MSTDIQDQVHHSASPVISIVTVITEVNEAVLRSFGETIQRQTYSHWEWMLVSERRNESTLNLLSRELTDRPGRIKLHYVHDGVEYAHICNEGLRYASGDFVAFLDGHGEMAPDCLEKVVDNLGQFTDVLYTDEDILFDDGFTGAAFHKPEYSPDLLMSTNYIGHSVFFRSELLTAIDGVRPKYGSATQYDLVLRAVEVARQVTHVNKILYHVRQHHPSDTTMLSEYDTLAPKAIQSAIKSRGFRGEVEVVLPHHYHVTYNLENRPLVSIIVPTKDKLEFLRPCIQSILEKSTYRNYEIIVVSNNSSDPSTLDFLDILKDNPLFKVIEADIPFNYSKLNNMAAIDSNGEYLLLLNNDTEVITPDWLEQMLGYAQLPHVGAVGAQLLYTDLTIQHGGILIDVNPMCSHAFYNHSSGVPGYKNLNLVTRDCSGVTGACFMIRKSLFREIGGLDEALDVEFNDVDLGLKIIEHGLCVVWNPRALLYHHESKSRGKGVIYENNGDYFRSKWKDSLAHGDRFFPSNRIRATTMMDGVRNSSMVAVFGASTSGLECLTELTRNSVQVACFIDNSTERQRSGFMGLPVYPVEMLPRLTKINAVVLASFGYKREMRQQVKSCGFQGVIVEY